MRALLVALSLVALSLVGCVASFETPETIEWTNEKWLATQDAAEMWQRYADIECNKPDDLYVQCSVRRTSWLVGLAASRMHSRGRVVDGYADYLTRRIWVFSVKNDLHLFMRLMAHEMGHALMPVAGNSETEGHTQTGVMRADGTPLVWTDEVIELCRAEGACR